MFDIKPHLSPCRCGNVCLSLSVFGSLALCASCLCLFCLASSLLYISVNTPCHRHRSLLLSAPLSLCRCSR